MSLLSWYRRRKYLKRAKIVEQEKNFGIYEFSFGPEEKVVLFVNKPLKLLGVMHAGTIKVEVSNADEHTDFFNSVGTGNKFYKHSEEWRANNE